MSKIILKTTQRDTRFTRTEVRDVMAKILGLTLAPANGQQNDNNSPAHTISAAKNRSSNKKLVK